MRKISRIVLFILAGEGTIEIFRPLPWTTWIVGACLLLWALPPEWETMSPTRAKSVHSDKTAE